MIALALTVVIIHFLLQRPWQWNMFNLLIFVFICSIIFHLVKDVRGSLEILVIAFIFAMIIRCFCIEVFKIPTGSMEPTLRGEGHYGIGDRILANKFIYFFKSVQRFDVVLFRYPLNKTSNFVKRVVGLPNEELMVKKGDIYYKSQGESNFILAKKPLKIQESIWIPTWVWDNLQVHQSCSKCKGEGNIKVRDWRRLRPWQVVLARCSQCKGEKEVAIPICRWDEAGDLTGFIQSFDKSFHTVGSVKLQKGKIYLDSPLAESFFTYRGPIEDRYYLPNQTSDGGKYNVSDVKIAFKCNQLQDAGEIQVRIKNGLNSFIVHLGNVSRVGNASSAQSDTEDRLLQVKANSFIEHINYKQESRSISISQPFKPQTEHQVEIMNFDGTFYIKLDKKIILKHNYQTVFEEDMFSDWDSEDKCSVSVGVVNSSAYVWDINLYRDIYYCPDYDKWGNSRGILKEGVPLPIPDKKYFMIGDHITSSKDSRLWQKKKIYLKNGEIIECDSDNCPSEDQPVIEIKRTPVTRKGGDIWGREHVIKQEDILKTECDYYSFVDEEEIFGKGLMVYWPLGRLKIIR